MEDLCFCLSDYTGHCGQWVQYSTYKDKHTVCWQQENCCSNHMWRKEANKSVQICWIPQNLKLQSALCQCYWGPSSSFQLMIYGPTLRNVDWDRDTAARESLITREYKFRSLSKTNSISYCSLLRVLHRRGWTYSLWNADVQVPEVVWFVFWLHSKTSWCKLQHIILTVECYFEWIMGKSSSNYWHWLVPTMISHWG